VREEARRKAFVCDDAAADPVSKPKLLAFFGVFGSVGGCGDVRGTLGGRWLGERSIVGAVPGAAAGRGCGAAGFFSREGARNAPARCPPFSLTASTPR